MIVEKITDFDKRSHIKKTRISEKWSFVKFFFFRDRCQNLQVFSVIVFRNTLNDNFLGHCFQKVTFFFYVYMTKFVMFSAMIVRHLLFFGDCLVKSEILLCLFAKICFFHDRRKKVWILTIDHFLKFLIFFFCIRDFSPWSQKKISSFY